MRNQYKTLNAGDVFSLWCDGRVVTAVKTAEGRAVDLHTGAVFDVFPTKNVDAPNTVDGTFQAAIKDGRPVFVRKLTSGHDDRFLCVSVLVVKSDIVFRHDLTLKQRSERQPDSQAGHRAGVDALLSELVRVVSRAHTLIQAAKALHAPEPVVSDVFEGDITPVTETFHSQTGRNVRELTG